jgi:uncharacterized membrane protein YccC
MTAPAARDWVTGGFRRTVARDPHGYSLRRALRPAVVSPIAFALGTGVTGNAQTATFAAFGSFALLLFVEFPGNRSSRFAAFTMLGLTGVVLIVLGTYLAEPAWLAVAGMAVIAFAVLFAGIISSITAAAGRAALLTFILPVMLPGSPWDIPARLLGWGIAFVTAVPVALFVWPPQDQSQLRLRAAAMCRTLAQMLQLKQPAVEGSDPRVAMSNAVLDLRAAFRASAARPVALSTGSRLLVRLVDELEWLTTTVLGACADAPESWPELGRVLRVAAAETLESCAQCMSTTGSGSSRVAREHLRAHIESLHQARRAVSKQTLAELRASAQVGEPSSAIAAAGPVVAGEFDRPLYAAHELGYVVGLAASTVAVIVAADARSWPARLAGRKPAGVEMGEAAAAERIAAGRFNWHSVWLQNSVRGAAGLAAAVLVARVSGQQQGFWIVLGALSVLRSNALTTGATAVRVVLGTIAGFAVGGLLVAAIGTNLVTLWILLPPAVLVAAFAPEAISFAVGQAAFTVVVIILFNIIAPSGWRIGVLRVEDVALGCAASIAAGFLFWPRGAGAALGGALARAFHTGADYLRQSVDYVTGRRSSEPDARAEAEASDALLDDALRQFLAEKGPKKASLEAVTALANAASRLRLAATAVARLKITIPGEGVSGLDAPVAQLVERTAEVTSWYGKLGGVLAGSGEPLPMITVSTDESFLDLILPQLGSSPDSGRAEQAERILWSGQYLGDVNRLRIDLFGPVAEISARRKRPWWRL